MESAIAWDFTVVRSVCASAMVKEAMKVFFCIYILKIDCKVYTFFYVDTDGECIEKMQETCERLKMPFEVLIQGNTGNRLVRSLFADPKNTEDDAVCLAKDPQSRLKRNTVSIYKPKSSASNDRIDNLKEVEHLLSEFEEDLDEESFGKLIYTLNTLF